MRKEYVATGSTVDAAIDAACLMADVTPDMADIEVLDLGGRGLFGFGRKDARVRVSVEVPDEPAGPTPTATTFGVKKSKRERFEEKHAKKQQSEIIIKPIITADAELAAEELAALKAAAPPKERRERPERPARKNERPVRGERPERLANLPPDLDSAPDKPARREGRAAQVTEGEMADQLAADARAFLEPIFAKLQLSPAITHEVQEGALWLNCAGDNLGLLIGRRGDTLNSLQYLTNLVVNKNRRDHVRLVLNVEGYRESREETLASLAHRMADKAVKTGRRIELEPMNPHERRVVHIALQNDKRVDTISHGEEPYRRIVISKKRAAGDKPLKPRRNRGRGGKPTEANGGEEA